MNVKKVFSALTLLLALTVVGCNNASKESAKPTSTPTSEPASEPEEEGEIDEALLTPLARTWADGASAKNSDGFDYIALSDAAANKVGVKIAITDCTVAEGATETTAFNSGGSIDPVNDHSAALAWKVKAPKAGNYQFVMTGKTKSSANTRTLSDRAFMVTLNGESVEVYGDRQPLEESATPFVAVPKMALTGQEDTITVSCSDYRIQFDLESFLLFQEI